MGPQRGIHRDNTPKKAYDRKVDCNTPSDNQGRRIGKTRFNESRVTELNVHVAEAVTHCPFPGF